MAVPPHGQSHRQQSQGGRHSDQQSGDLCVAPLQRELGRQVLVDGSQIAGVGGPEKLCPSDLGHFLQSRFVHPGVKGKTLKTRNEAIGRAKRHGVDTNTLRCRPFGHLDWIRSSGAPTIRQQNHGSRRVRTHWQSLMVPWRRRGALVQRTACKRVALGDQAAGLEFCAVQQRLQVNRRLGQQCVQGHQQTTASGCGSLQLKTVDGVQQEVLLIGHALHELRIARKRHHSHAHMVG